MQGFENQFQSLAQRARFEKAPVPDVADSVMQKLRSHATGSMLTENRPLIWLAGFSSLLACSIVILAIALTSQPDPLAEVMESIAWVIQ